MNKGYLFFALIFLFLLLNLRHWLAPPVITQVQTSTSGKLQSSLELTTEIPAETKPIENIDERPKRKRNAFVYLSYNAGHKFGLLQLSIERLASAYGRFPEGNTDIVVFVEGVEPFQAIVAKLSHLPIKLVVVNPKQWDVNLPTGAYPVEFRPRWDPGFVFNVRYREMSHYAAGYLVTHPFFEQYEFAIKLDTDTFCRGQWKTDPFEGMKGKKFGYWHMVHFHLWGITDNLFEVATEFARENNIQWKTPRLVCDANGKYRQAMFAGHFFGFETAFFREPTYQKYFAKMDQYGGYFKHRWDEQTSITIYLAMMAEFKDIEFFSYLQMDHQDLHDPQAYIE